MNVFEGIVRNHVFLIIVFAIFVLQIILVTFGSTALGVYAYFGLNIKQWLFSIAIGMMSLLVGLLAKVIPEEKICLKFGSKEVDPQDNKEMAVSLKRKATSF